MLIYGASFDYWGTLASPNLDYAKARTEFLADLFGCEPEVAHAKYKKIKAHADHCAEYFGTSLAPLQCVRMLIECERKTRDVNATEVLLEWEDIILQHLPIVTDSMYQLLIALSDYIPIAITSNTNFISGRILRSTLPDVFTTMVFSDEIGFTKPLPEVFQYTYNGLSKSLQNPSLKGNFIHIGDHLKCDKDGAERFGMQSLKVTGAKHTEEVIDRYIKKGWFE